MGPKMQDDLIDAADWAVNQGIARRDRMGLWGWSYSGYATLEALATTARFACGMAMYAPTDLESFVAETDPDPRVLGGRCEPVGNDMTGSSISIMSQTDH